MRYRRVVCLCIVVVLLAQPVLGDVIGTRNGEKFVGRLANREEVRADPRALDTIGMLLSDSGELLRFRVQDVEYIVLQDGDLEQVIDLLSSPRRGASPGSPAYPTMRRENHPPVLIALGFAAGTLGLLYKFGGPKCTISSSSMDCDEKSYSGINYALMAAGALLVVIGITQSHGEHNNAHSQSAPPGAAPIIWLGPERTGVHLGFGYRFIF